MPSTPALARLAQAFAIWLLLSLLAGCASQAVAPTQTSVPPAAQHRFATLQAVQSFDVEAKLAVQYAGKGYTARLEWQHSPALDTLRIFSPLGQQVALIERSAHSVTLTDQSGNTHQAADVSSLTAQLLGWRLPLTGLSQWILGAPHINSPFQASYLAQGEPARLMQDQWQIDYDDYREVQLQGVQSSLPHITRLQQQNVRLKLVIQHW